MVSKINQADYQEYMDRYVTSFFKPLVEKDVYSIIINREFCVEIATNQSAISVGCCYQQDLTDISSKDSSEDAFQRLFGKLYSSTLHDDFVNYAKKIHYLQQIVFERGVVVKFIDMLPYNERFIIYITSYVPVIHPNGEVIAIHSTSIESYILRFQGHLRKPNLEYEKKEFKACFSNRELEVLFLLTNGATQDQIAQILDIARGTVSGLIGNQICPKFNIAGSNTKLLIDAAINAGFYLDMPQSLWKPCVIVLNKELLDDPLLKEIAER